MPSKDPTVRVQKVIWTIGHSNHDSLKFATLLYDHQITAVADVRSHPFSRYCPHFNLRPLKTGLENNGVAYTFLGKELGARTSDDSCYDQEGRVLYRRLAESPEFQEGLKRLDKGLRLGYRIALMCSEREPLDCHRTVLVSHELIRRGYEVRHIHADSSVERHEQAMQRLSRMLKLKVDLFSNEEQRVEEACRLQEQKIAYKRKPKTQELAVSG